MTLAELLAAPIAEKTEHADIEICGISQDSRLIKDGYLFLACAGSRNTHGIAYGGEAAKNGAVAIVWEPTSEVADMPYQISVQREGTEVSQVPLIAVSDLHLKAGNIAARFCSEPSANMNVFGVTGTNGKTSIAFFIAQCLSYKNSCGVLGTIGNGIIDKGLKQIKDSSHTTADAITLQNMMAEMYAHGVKQVALEVSSHALDQARVNGVQFSVVIFTNLSRDHLDYHGDMETYAAAKRSLFFEHDWDTAVINSDDPVGQQMIAELKASGRKVLSYSMCEQNSADIQAESIQALTDGMQFKLSINGKHQLIKVSLLGDFNISNVLATAGALTASNFEFEQTIEYLQKMTSVPGRMEIIRKPTKCSGGLVIVDYAHTPDALEQALLALQNHIEGLGDGKICCVFGCGGNRDKGKRPLMGQIAEQLADYLILTNDNPRDEEPIDIIADIESGLSKNVDYRIEIDRKKAIHSAMERSQDGDIVLIAGKGHETYQEVKGIRHYFSDQEVVKEYYASQKNKCGGEIGC